MSDPATNQGAVSNEQLKNRQIEELAAFLGAEEPPEEEKPTEAAAEEEPTQVEQALDGDSEEESEAEGEEAERAGKEESTEEEVWKPQSFEELAQALEIEPDELAAQLKVTTKIDGEIGQASLADLKKSFQLEGALNKRLEAVANERKELKAQHDQFLHEYQSKTQAASDTIDALERMMVEDFQSIDWQELKENDPTQYVIEQQNLQQRFARLNVKKKELEADRQKQTEQYQQQFGQQYETYLSSQKDALFERMPELKDEKVLKETISGVQDYMRGMGASDQEIYAIADHRIWMMAIKAMKYDKMNSKAETAKKQMKSKPKFVPPGLKKDRVSESQDNQRKKIERAKKLQTTDAWTDALMDKLGLG